MICRGGSVPATAAFIAAFSRASRSVMGAMHLRQCFDVVCPLDAYESLTMTGQAGGKDPGHR